MKSMCGGAVDDDKDRMDESLIPFPKEKPVIFYKKIDTGDPEKQWQGRFKNYRRSTYSAAYDIQTRAREDLGNSELLRTETNANNYRYSSLF